MSLKIRLRQHGKTNRQFYRLVVADSCSPRDGKFVETIGWYNPNETAEDLHMNVKNDRVQHWLDLGAEPSEKAEALIRRAAPHIMKDLQAKRMVAKAKLTAKKRERRRKNREKALSAS